MELAQAPNVIDVCVRADDDFYNKLVAPDQVQDARDFVAGVDHQRFARVRIADDRAVALQHPYRNGDVDQSIGGGIESRSTVAHDQEYIIGVKGIAAPAAHVPTSACIPAGGLRGYQRGASLW